MGAPYLFLRLRERGITLSALPDGNLLVKPAARLTDADRDVIRAHKAALADRLLLRDRRDADVRMLRVH